MAQFLVQGGDPSGTGRGGVGLDGGLLDDEISEQLVHDRRGILAMANKGPNTNGSQFYITYGRQSQLDGTSSVIGRVIHGFETLDAMERVPVDDKYRPKRDISIQRVTIHANPFAN